MPRFSLLVRAGSLCAVLLCLMAFSLLYLSLRIGNGEQLIRAQLDSVESQAEQIDRQRELAAEQQQRANRLAQFIAEQDAQAVKQDQLAADQRRLMDAQTAELNRLWVISKATNAFASIRYWTLDFGLSQRKASADQISKHYEDFAFHLESLQRLDGADLERLSQIHSLAEQYAEELKEALRAFERGEDGLGRDFIEKSRVLGESVQTQLEKLLASSDVAMTSANDRTVEFAAQLGDNAHKLRKAIYQGYLDAEAVAHSSREVDASAESVRQSALHVRELAAEVSDQHHLMYDVSLLLFGAAVAAGFVLSLLFVRRIVNPLRRLANIMQSIAAGRGGLEQNLAIRSQDELVSLADAFDQMMLALRKTTVSSAFFNDILQSMSDMLLVVDHDARARLVNHALLSRLGYEESELLGRTVDRLFASTSALKELTGAKAARRRLAPVEASLRNKDGALVPVLLSVGELSREAGGGLVCVAQDIRRLKAAERAIKASEERFKHYAEAGSDWYWEMDENLRFSYFSPHFTEVTGVSQNQLLGKSRRETGIIPGLEQAVWDQHLDLLDKHLPFKRFVHPRSRPDGRLVWVSIDGTPVFDDDGNFRGYRGIGRDITDQEETRRQLVRARDEAAAAAQTKAQFLANMSHEIRTPMNGVLGMLELLEESDLDPEQRELVSVAHSSGDTLLNLLNGILDLSKIEADKLVLESIEFDPANLAEDVCDLLSELALAKGIDLACVVKGAPQGVLLGDPTRIRQILTNLLSNAIKFTNKGEVTLELTFEPLNQRSCGVGIEVSDTGIGIKEEQLDSIFDAFTQADGSTTRQFGGSGLGLAICSQLVRAMKGSISVESSLGQGSKFSVHFQFDSIPGRVATLSEFEGLRVLVAGVEGATGKAVLRALSSWGVQQDIVRCPTALKCALAGSSADSEPYDLCIADPEQLDVADSDLRAWCLARDEDSPTGLLLISSRALQQSGAAVDMRQSCGYIARPVRRSTLAAKIRGVLEPGAQVPEAAGTGPSVRPKRSNRVLVVEDNPVNQRVLHGMLGNLGYEADTADNGQIAIERLAKSTYDLILMDCQMPVLDGYEATQRIRSGQWPQCNLPIVAVTANAMAGDAEKCLQVGMNDHMAKPVRLDALRVMLEKWLPVNDTKSTQLEEPTMMSDYSRASERPTVDTSPVIDSGTFDTLADILGDAIDEIVALFQEDAPELAAKIDGAIAAGDCEAAKQFCHTLKGSSANLGLTRLSDAAKVMEHLGRDGDLDALKAHQRRLANELAAARAALVNRGFDGSVAAAVAS